MATRPNGAIKKSFNKSMIHYVENFGRPLDATKTQCRDPGSTISKNNRSKGDSRL